jgi:acetyl esterase
MKVTWVEVSDELKQQSRLLNDAIEQVLGSMDAVHHVDPAETRKQRAEGTHVWPPPVRMDEAVDRTVSALSREVPVRVMVPDNTSQVDGVFLHLHGGGWTIGAADQQDPALWTLATGAKVAVVSVEYRLGPEDPYPLPNDDCETAAMWLLEHAAEEFGTDRLVIGGESAGAHLTATTLLRLRDRHDAATRFGGANLVFGDYDLAVGTPSNLNWGERNLILSTPIIDWFCENYLSGLSVEERRDPDISPLFGSLEGLPPALFTVGALDPLLDDSLFMATRWAAAGNDAEVLVYPDSIHGFTGFPTGIADQARANQVEFIVRSLAP